MHRNDKMNGEWQFVWCQVSMVTYQNYSIIMWKFSYRSEKRSSTLLELTELNSVQFPIGPYTRSIKNTHSLFLVAIPLYNLDCHMRHHFCDLLVLLRLFDVHVSV